MTPAERLELIATILLPLSILGPMALAAVLHVVRWLQGRPPTSGPAVGFTMSSIVPTQGLTDWSGDTSVWLQSPGPNLVKVVDLVRDAKGLGLQDAFELVAGAPVAVLQAAPFEHALQIHGALVAAGARAELRREGESGEGSGEARADSPGGRL